MRRYLMAAEYVIVTEQVGQDALRRYTAHGPASFHVVVPALVDRDGDLAAARAAAEARLAEYQEKARAAGVEATGEVGPADVLDAIDAALHKQDVDEIVLFTEPPGVSAWLKQDLVSRARRRFALPVTDVSTRLGGG